MIVLANHSIWSHIDAATANMVECVYVGDAAADKRVLRLRGLEAS